MKFDFSKSPPQLETLKEAQAFINGLWCYVSDAQKSEQGLLLKIADLEEKLNTNSSNSSKSPSSDIFKKKKPKKRNTMVQVTRIN